MARPHLLPKDPTPEPNQTDAVWKPQPGPQTVAYYSVADVVGYGGAAGGGKSDLELGAALTRHRRSIIFRREKLQARDLMDRAVEILDKAGEPYEATRSPTSMIYIPRGDRQIEFGGIQSPDDWRKYKGRPKDGIMFDEATEFEEMMPRSLAAWNRTAIENQRCQIVMGFNPPSTKHGLWLIDYFGPWLNPKHPNPAQYGELRWFTTLNGVDIECPNSDPLELSVDGKSVQPRCNAPAIDTKEGPRCSLCKLFIIFPLSRTFIKALLDDNAYYAATNYRAKLMSLPEPLRSQLLRGDFQAEEADEPNQCIPTKWVLLANERWQHLADTATTPDGKPDAPLSAIGADVARGGINKTVFVARVNTWFDWPEDHPGSETQDGPTLIKLLALFMTHYRRVRKVPVGMDVIGVGSSPVDFGKLQDLHIMSMVGGGAPPDNATDRSGLLGFKNLRAYWYWSLREALDPVNGQNLAIPPDRELLADLCAPTYDDRSLRGIQIEDKKMIAKRLGRSPDKGDAFVYAFAVRPFVVGYESVTTAGKGRSAFVPVRVDPRETPDGEGRGRGRRKW